MCLKHVHYSLYAKKIKQMHVLKLSRMDFWETANLRKVLGVLLSYRKHSKIMNGFHQMFFWEKRSLQKLRLKYFRELQPETTAVKLS